MIFLNRIFLIALLFASCKGIENNRSNVDSILKNDDPNEVVIAANSLAYSIANDHDQFYSFIGVRALAMSHLAIHDALNAIDRNYNSYAFIDDKPTADPISSVVQAAYEVLVAAYPKRKDTLDFFRNHWLKKVPDGAAKSMGIELGKASASAIIQLRAGDGHEKQGNYTPMTKPGDYQYTPEFDWVWKPDFSYARPFSLDSVSQFRSPPPPALSSEAYAKSYNEVKDYGIVNSKIRTEDQTHIAHWWAEFGEHSWNRIGRLTADDNKISLRETARMFALINMNLYDLYLASFDSKYHYDTWRPYTAIRSGSQDDNPLTEEIKDWTPEMLTPPWPEYPSAHAAVGAGGAYIVSQVYGTSKVRFTMSSVTAPEEAPQRTYNDLNAASNDCADSRILNGFHFRFATEEGKKQGLKVANHVYNHALRPTEGR